MNTEDLESVSKELEKELSRLEANDYTKTSKSTESIDDNVNNIHSDDENNTDNTDNTDNIETSKIKALMKHIKEMPKWLKVSSIVFSVFLILGISALTYVNHMLGKINYEDPDHVVIQSEPVVEDEDFNPDLEEIDPNDVALDVPDNGGPHSDANVINILLIGDENMGGGIRGRSDAIMIASINKSQKKIKLTSIMRDTYVQIPGYSNNRINHAYSIGGAPLLASTIENNFGIQIDGYALVGYSSFETIINKIDGVEITLTSAEASYLNRTNYISNPAYRNVKTGTQILNGNQALGYARIRHVGNSDYERTNRHKRVLIAIYEKYKSASLTKMLDTLDYLLENITTNVQRADIISYVTTVATIGATEIETFRIPADNTFEPKNVNKMAVLIPDLQKNIALLREFVYGADEIMTHLDSTDNISVTQ